MKIRTTLIAGTVACMALSGTALAQVAFTKVQVADRIRKVEDGVDEFRKWSEKRVEQGQTARVPRPPRPGGRGKKATESQKAVANEKKDEFDDALGDLNPATNRLRRSSTPPTSGWRRGRKSKTSWTTRARSTRYWCAASTARRPNATGRCCAKASTTWRAATT